MKFYKETEFQETEMGEIPREWKLEKLGYLVNYIKGKKPRKLYNEKISENLVPYLTAEYMRGLETPNWCNPQEGKELVKVKEEDIIMIWDGSYAGHVFRGFNGILASTMIKIVPKQEINEKFLYYFLAKNLQAFRVTTTGTGIPHVDKRVFNDFLVSLPPIKEQQTIAGILLTVDSAIKHVDNLVARLNNLKKALMNELLTGRIRIREQNGKFTFYTETDFQETEIGKIPKEWEVVKLDNKELAEIIMGQSPPSSTYNREGKGLPFLQGKMEFGDIYPSPRMYCSQPIKIAEPNDILISVRAPVGDINIAPYKLCIGRGLAAIRFNLNRASHWFYFYYFQKIKNFLENLGKGSTFKAITKEDLENLKVPYPSLFEQQRIADILSTVDRTIELYYKEKDVLGRLKKGLMDVLLTGKVRMRED
jgi:type I restriction enzyme S subunit